MSERTVDRAVRAKAFETIRRRQVREQFVGMTPAERMARAEDLRTFSLGLATRPSHASKDESPEVVLRLLRHFREIDTPRP